MILNKTFKIMRFLAFIAVLSVISLKGFSQSNVVKQLQVGKWFVTGSLGEKNLILSSKSSGDWNATFLAKGKMKYCGTAKSEMPDPTVAGKNIPAGSAYCDSQYTYEVKNNVININYGPANFFYSIKKIADGYELIPTEYTNFK